MFAKEGMWSLDHDCVSQKNRSRGWCHRSATKRKLSSSLADGRCCTSLEYMDQQREERDKADEWKAIDIEHEMTKKR